ncbi:MAG: glycosyltransferase family 87 protein [Terracidiphilus sp.]
MTRTRWIVLLCLLLSCGVSVSLGFFLERAKPDLMMDFKGVYFQARCLLQHTDPYKPDALLRAYLADGRDHPMPTDGLRSILTWYIYLPTASIFFAPFAMLPMESAQILWMILTAAALVLAGYLMWDLGADYSPVMSACLVCLVLANSEVLFATGNPAGIAVSLCLVAVWCFLKERLIWAGVLCLAISLAIKPHNAGLVWLFFLLAGGVCRKRALQTLIATVALTLPSILWVWQVSPHWMQEWHSNITAFSARGGLTDPGPDSAISLSMMINLQAAISVFRNDPRIYNLVSYLICGTLLLVWMLITLRSPLSPKRAWLALAAIAALSMLPVYHRPNDAKLLLLAVPACAMLWAEGGRMGRLALLLTAGGILATSDLPMVVFLAFTRNMHLSTAGLSGQLLAVALTRPVPLILLAMGIFYLWIYLQREPAGSQQ